MLQRILLTAVLLASANDYDYLRAMHETSTRAFQRWWRYRCDWVVLDDAVAHTETARKDWRLA